MRLFSCCVKLVYFVPVDHWEESFDVVRTNVAVFHVVGMFPNVQAQDWFFTFWDWCVLVCCWSHFKLTFFVNNQPCPSRTETSCCCRSKCCLEFFEWTKCCIDCCCKFCWRSCFSGVINSQKRAWFKCPPPLLISAWRISAGIDSTSASKASRSSPISGCFSRAAFALFT